MPTHTSALTITNYWVMGLGLAGSSQLAGADPFRVLEAVV